MKFGLLLLIVTLFHSGEEKVAPSQEKICPALVGSAFPDAMVRNSQGQEKNLRAEATGKPTILIFFRGGW